MARFVYRLQPLLNVKKQMEDNKKNELGKELQKLEVEKVKLKKIETSKEECIDDFNTCTSHGATIGKIKEYNIYLSFLNDKLWSQKQDVKLQEDNVDKVREELIGIVQEREMLDKLKEKNYQRFMEEQLKEEQKLLDEVASYKHNKSLTGDKNGQGTDEFKTG